MQDEIWEMWTMRNLCEAISKKCEQCEQWEMWTMCMWTMRNLCEAISEKCQLLECKISRLEISERAELGNYIFWIFGRLGNCRIKVWNLNQIGQTSYPRFKKIYKKILSQKIFIFSFLALILSSWTAKKFPDSRWFTTPQRPRWVFNPYGPYEDDFNPDELFYYL